MNDFFTKSVNCMTLTRALGEYENRFSERFQHLSLAPVVEAVIDFRAKPTYQCEQAQLKHISKRISGFPDFRG